MAMNISRVKCKMLYWDKKLTLTDIAKALETSYSTVRRFFKKNNIKIRRTGWSGKKANNINLTKKLIDFLNGLLLGDGSLMAGKTACACYSHGDKNKDFIEWLYLKFKSFGIKGRMRKYKNQEAYAFRTLNYYEFYDVLKRWYGSGKKKIPFDFVITPTSLKYWYIGDGNCTDVPLIDSSIFSLKNLTKISLDLKKKGIDNTLRKFKDRKRIRIATKSVKCFFKYILSIDSEIPQSYFYKFMKG